MTGSSWRAVSVPTQKSNGDLPRASGLTASPGRTEARDTARVLSGAPGRSRRTDTALIGMHASTPDDAAYVVGLGDGFTIEMLVWMKTWRPPSTVWLASHGDISPVTDLDFAFGVESDGKLHLAIGNPAGDTDIGLSSTVSVPFLPGTQGWIKAVYFQNIFTVGLIQYSTSTTGIAFSALGADRNLGAAQNPHDSAAGITIPSETPSEDVLIFSANIFYGGTTAVASPQFSTLSPGTTSFRDDPRKQWTVNSPGLIGVV